MKPQTSLFYEITAASSNQKCLTHTGTLTCKLSQYNQSWHPVDGWSCPLTFWLMQCTLTPGTGRWSCSPAEARTSSATGRPFSLQPEPTRGGGGGGGAQDCCVTCTSAVNVLSSCWGVFWTFRPFCVASPTDALQPSGLIFPTPHRSDNPGPLSPITHWTQDLKGRGRRI